MSVRCPSWLWVLLGVVLVQAVPSAPPPQMDEADLHSRLPYVELESWQPELLSVRRLRQIPGIGQIRALAIARERWRAERAGEPFVLLDVSGIGPSTAAQIMAWQGNSSP